MALPHGMSLFTGDISVETVQNMLSRYGPQEFDKKYVDVLAYIASSGTHPQQNNAIASLVMMSRRGGKSKRSRNKRRSRKKIN